MNIITSEIYKITKSKFFYALIAILGGLNIAGLISGIQEKFSGVKSGMPIEGFYVYQDSYNFDGIFYIILIFIVFLITSEYANGSIRQIACRGIARWKIVIGKYIAMSIITSLVFYIFGIINLIVFSLLFELGQVNIAAFIKINFGILSIILGTSGIASFLSYLLKNGGITILVSILFVSASKFLTGFLSVVTKNSNLSMYNFTNMRKTVVDLTSSSQEVIKVSIVFLVVALVTMLLSIILFTKRDVD